MLKNKSGSLNCRRTTDVHIDQVVFQPSVEPFQIQGLLYKLLGGVLYDDNRARSEPSLGSLENIWHCLCPQHASAHHRIPGELSVSLLLASRHLLLHHSQQHGRSGEHRTRCGRDPCSTHHHLFTDTPEAVVKASASKRMGHKDRGSHLQPYISGSL